MLCGYLIQQISARPIPKTCYLVWGATACGGETTKIKGAFHPLLPDFFHSEGKKPPCACWVVSLKSFVVTTSIKMSSFGQQVTGWSRGLWCHQGLVLGRCQSKDFNCRGQTFFWGFYKCLDWRTFVKLLCFLGVWGWREEILRKIPIPFELGLKFLCPSLGSGLGKVKPRLLPFCIRRWFCPHPVLRFQSSDHGHAVPTLFTVPLFTSCQFRLGPFNRQFKHQTLTAT